MIMPSRWFACKYSSLIFFEKCFFFFFFFFNMLSAAIVISTLRVSLVSWYQPPPSPPLPPPTPTHTHTHTKSLSCFQVWTNFSASTDSSLLNFIRAGITVTHPSWPLTKLGHCELFLRKLWGPLTKIGHCELFLRKSTCGQVSVVRLVATFPQVPDPTDFIGIGIPS